MSVHWQDNSYYRALKDYEKETGMSLAERNALANPNGNHSTLGVLGVSLFSAATNFAMNKWGSGLGGNDTGSETDVETERNLITRSKTIRSEIDTAINKNDTYSVNKWLNAFKDLANDRPNNRTIQQTYKLVKEQVEEYNKSVSIS